MSAEAVVMMIVAMLVLWGGLVAAVVNIARAGGGDPQDLHRDL